MKNANIAKLIRKKNQKKFLTKRKRFDKISKLSREKNDRNLDN